jgi:hypothetical protein
MTLIRDSYMRALLYVLRVRKDMKLKNRKLRLHPEFVETNSIFIHIPKTAGYSVALALYGRDPWHFPLSKYEAITEPKDFYTFTVVRDPAKRLLSMHGYLKKLKRIHPELRSLKEAGDFSEFLDAFVATRHLAHKHPFLVSQVDYITNSQGEIAVNFIGKMENLEHDFEIIKKGTNLPDAQLQHLNKSLGSPKIISPRDQKFIETHFANEYERLGY